jgi:hypothetical protein
MSLTRDLFESTRTIPQEGETYGDDLSDTLDSLIQGVDGAAMVLSGSSKVALKANTETGTTSLAAGGTLTATASRMRIQGTSSAVTLSASTAIADGDSEGQLLILQGGHATNTVTILGDANTSLNGDCVLEQYNCLGLVWDVAASLWIELFRSH